MAKCLDCQTEYHENGCNQIGCTMSILVGTSFAAHMINHFEAGRPYFNPAYTFGRGGQPMYLTTPKETDPLYRQTIGDYRPWEAPQNTCPRCYHRGYPEYVGTSLVDNTVDMYSQVYDHIEYINTRCWEQDKLDVYDVALKLNTLIHNELPNHMVVKLYRISVVYCPTLRSVSAHVGYDARNGYSGFAVYL